MAITIITRRVTPRRLVSMAMIISPSEETKPSSKEASAPVGQAEEQEPNGKISEATLVSIDTEVKAYLSEGDDVDVFAFETGQGYRNVFEITVSNQGSFAPDVIIFDKTKTRIENKYSITPGADIIIPLSAQPSSKYFVLVKDLDGLAGRLGDYQLAIKSK